MNGPYNTAAVVYQEAGFSPLPITENKILMVRGVSGRYPPATGQQIKDWTTKYGGYEIALRLLPGTIALDIDEYKGDLTRLAELEREFGKLPTTCNADSRGGRGGKLLFRVNPMNGLWKSEINGITVIQHTHRYVMVSPSFNAKSNSVVKWYDGLGGSHIPNWIPRADGIPTLPSKWVNALLRGFLGDYQEPPTEPNHETLLTLFDSDPPCDLMTRITADLGKQLQAARDGSLHDTALRVLGRLVRIATDHSGLAWSLNELRGIFVTAERHRDLGQEWNNAVEYVLAQVEEQEINSDTCKRRIFYEPQRTENPMQRFQAAGLSARVANRIIRGEGLYAPGVPTKLGPGRSLRTT